ncbi:hypothetical protein IFR09_04370 [Pseudomonas syringae]|nr:hypothetical protein [Pseudomonas syringae]MBD8574133.1 hypothetical protein [Pseudomonas syringae]MBD8791083.1 hypothetical protein [Pseudomonas syringae]MBD8801329.1 hypothetical protein [Pseudomonas syringae]MBD8810394.1 hypothetical protein [Pseudomonas syringae]
MRLFRSLTLLLTVALTLIAPSAFADGLYQVETILFRQLGEVPATPQRAPEHWDAGATRVTSENQRSPALTAMVDKLQASGQYQVLLHRAWQQSIGSEPSVMAVTDGQGQFGHYPVEGTLSLAIGRFIDYEADFWVNQMDAHGVLVSSERLKQSARIKHGELTFLDYGSLALLVKVSPL